MKTLSLQLSQGLRNVVNIFYPHLCAGCGDDIQVSEAILCYKCLERLPVTNFHLHPGNLVEKIFWGRLSVAAATSFCYFTKDTLVQQLLHQLKYKGNQAVGRFMGKMIGESLMAGGRFQSIDLIVPLPLHERKERIRGFNQAEIIAEGIAAVTGWPVAGKLVQRKSFTETQTQKGRSDRWENMKERFECSNSEALRNKHVLLIDDVVTTGATLEACGTEILKTQGATLSISTMAYAIK